MTYSKRWLWLFAMIGASFANAEPMKIVLVGDSTVAEGGGWGPGFRATLGDRAEVVNLALNGRSSKSFRDEGAWAAALTAKAAYILIQFGHNDVPGKGVDRETEPESTYRANMIRYVEEARASGATPILVTSIVRRNFTEEGKIIRDSLVPYVAQVRLLASENKILMIDLYSLTLEQSEKLGPTGCEDIGARTAEGKLDTTHLSPKGQQEIGEMTAREFLRLVSSTQH